VIDVQFADASPTVIRVALIAFFLMPLIAGLAFAQVRSEVRRASLVPGMG
jgi:hypothetical protein